MQCPEACILICKYFTSHTHLSHKNKCLHIVCKTHISQLNECLKKLWPFIALAPGSLSLYKRAPGKSSGNYKLLAHTLAYVKMSLHIELHYFNRSRAISKWPTHPHLHTISSRGGEVFNKPWRCVEGTAGVSRTTPLSIPERVRRLQSTRNISVVYTEGRVTEVVISDMG